MILNKKNIFTYHNSQFTLSDYDNNKITITFPEYYLTGNTQKPTQKPQLPEGEYKIEIYQTNTATTALTETKINLIQMPFNLTFYHHDHLGTTRYITNENGEILHTTDTLAYGEELTAPYENDKDEVLNTITYTGHEKDYETDLTYMLARYYSQGYGTFISPDTFDLLGKINSLSSQTNDPEKLAQLETLMTNPLYWNKYIYCLDNPVNRVEKDGKFSVIEVALAAVTVTSVTVAFMEFAGMADKGKAITQKIAKTYSKDSIENQDENNRSAGKDAEQVHKDFAEFAGELKNKGIEFMNSAGGLPGVPPSATEEGEAAAKVANSAKLLKKAPGVWKMVVDKVKDFFQGDEKKSQEKDESKRRKEQDPTDLDIEE